MLVAKPNSTIIKNVKELLKFEFDIKDLGVAKKIVISSNRVESLFHWIELNLK